MDHLFFRYSSFSKQLGLIPLLALLFIWGCSKDSGVEVQNPDPTFESLYNVTFKTKCLTCHQPGTDYYDNQGILIDFRTLEQAKATIEAQVSVSMSASACSNINYVTNGDLNNSYLLAILDQTYAVNNYGNTGCLPPYNSHSIQIRPALTTAEISSLEQWIRSGVGF